MENAALSIAVENFMCLTKCNNTNCIDNYRKIRKNKMRIKVVLALSKTNARNPRKIPKMDNFWEVITKMPDDVFSSHFRMQIATFKKLKRALKPFWPNRKTGRPSLSLAKSLYVTLWKLCNQNCFREVSDRFGIGVGTAYRSFIKTTRVILRLKSRIIVFPSTEASQRLVMEQFEASRALPFPFVLGCIDGTHIHISQPLKDSTSYYNRKGTYSIIVQAIADSKFRFLDAFIGHPGRCHDASVWNNSPIRRAIVTNKIKIPQECHLLGDCAYPLETYLMVPYKDNGHLSEEQKRFNYVLSSTRVFVEQAFGVLKKKFRILNYLELQNLALAKQIIMACMVLHNVIIDNENVTPDMEIIEECNTISDLAAEEYSHSQKEEAKRKRSRLTTLLSA